MKGNWMILLESVEDADEFTVLERVHGDDVKLGSAESCLKIETYIRRYGSVRVHVVKCVTYDVRMAAEVVSG